MALVAKRIRIMALKDSERGQISIFFSASLVVFISVIAFVINVGLFVKAKINLQNATDASAFAGAAVQSRQLTKIAYLNWEMRNIFKEWMYKYYVVGSLNTPMVENTTAGNTCDSGRNCMDFRLATDTNAISGLKNFDPYNFPAVCIHIAGSKTNICKRYAVPGLPEFGGYNIPGTEEASRSFVDILIGEKVNNCVERSKINMLVNTTWAYNVISGAANTNTLAGQGPAILADRQGAWPKAMELAMRIRNLEKIMNREAEKKAVCIGGIGNCTPIDEFSLNEKKMGNERIVKAFYSGYRNLGNEADNEMKNSFSLQELPPSITAPPDSNSSSSHLIPETAKYPKQFVDLKLMMVNYATFYAALIPRSTLDTSGACDISKVALPVPGYPLGFYKNPAVVTYYAVKGEAEFTGMFNPFSAETIKLTAYAAAKPMGGRIGPMLFKENNLKTATTSRSDTSKFRSVPYIATLKIENVYNAILGRTIGAGEYGPGVPLPLNLGANPFWLVDSNSPIGGKTQGEPVQFGIPNLVYDFTSATKDPTSYSNGTDPLYIIQPGPPNNPAQSNFLGDRAVGLFNPDQFKAFKGTIGGTVTPDELLEEISRVRSATQYEAANYLIPTPFDFNIENDVDSFGMVGRITDTTPGGVKRYNVDVYAPLFKGPGAPDDLLYENSGDVVTTMITFMREQEQGMLNYIHSLNKAAIEIYKTAGSGSVAAIGAEPGFKVAARRVSEINVTSTDPDYHNKAFPDETCDSLAAQFWHFYFGDPRLFNRIKDQSKCPVTLVSLLDAYYAQSPSAAGYSSTHYKMEYNYNAPYWESRGKLKIFSAYMPGPYNGIRADGTFDPPPGFPPSKEVMRRNFYSTKLIALDSVQKGKPGYDEAATNFAIYSESEMNNATLDRKQTDFLNPLDAQSVGADIRSIRY